MVVSSGHCRCFVNWVVVQERQHLACDRGGIREGADMADAGDGHGAGIGYLASQGQRMRRRNEAILRSCEDQRRRRDGAETVVDGMGEDGGATLLLRLVATCAREDVDDFR